LFFSSSSVDPTFVRRTHRWSYDRRWCTDRWDVGMMLVTVRHGRPAAFAARGPSVTLDRLGPFRPSATASFKRLIIRCGKSLPSEADPLRPVSEGPTSEASRRQRQFMPTMGTWRPPAIMLTCGSSGCSRRAGAPDERLFASAVQDFGRTIGVAGGCRCPTRRNDDRRIIPGLVLRRC
jgi:hypothetical protein